MTNIAGAITNTVSISQFNRGLAGKIFEDVKTSGAKVVMKNNAAECVLLSPQEYLDLMDEVNDARLLTIASQRLENYDPADAVTLEEMQTQFGVSDEDLDGYEGVTIE